ncbi:type I-E CRISPR-associated protein Cse1/CasA [Xenorhabdus hominickii]|uniref:Type I-E CRISPR-associated protein Cse1/CasA n=1 Tax=Xenorhabdus hominickii TaxID=351679 RepID=A0A2G0QDM4_XENHO|nr:type I-E CRISPR-associated protein Cse1/CasA [Xenorhabdus hominickii]AOM41423.1 type I-E CRISPR-associated protein Cse1/CasA [Xenorhabdus hominickii]PHM57337.1 type I-E CRISPR-associated protein Cse1/CasA [Xenorhabdus hominickii]
MNLVKDAWLTFRMRNGSEEKLPLAAICDPAVMDFSLPRSDFQGAVYQLAIGLLQTVFAPEDKYEWHDFYEQAPTQADLQTAFNRVEHAFNLIGDGPLFMQDFDSLAERKSTSISGLLIESPGEKTLKDNTDHFIKRGKCEVISPEMAAIALFTLQINAPAGNVGLRGGGPLTTLIQLQNWALHYGKNFGSTSLIENVGLTQTLISVVQIFFRGWVKLIPAKKQVQKSTPIMCMSCICIGQCHDGFVWK